MRVQCVCVCSVCVRVCDAVIVFFIQAFLFCVAQNQWLRDNVLDHFGNYIYCVSCLTAYLKIGNHRLHRQRVIKQQLMTEPVIRMSKRDVICHRLELYVLPPTDEVM